MQKMNLTPSDGFPYYISLVGSNDLDQLFRSAENFKFLSSLTDEQVHYRYASGKWSIKQIVGHITDHERIMSYRALRFSRKDATQSPGYDQNLLVENSRFNEMIFKDLLEDFKNVRSATITLMKSFSPEQMACKGMAWKFELTVAETLKATIGHEMHHIKILKEKYLK
jgi:hypothetical protein